MFTVQQSGMTAAVTKSDFTFTTATGDALTISQSSMLTSSFSNGGGETTFELSFISSSTQPHLDGDKTKLPLSVTVTKDARSDSTQIVALDGGVAGVSGASGSSVKNVSIVCPSPYFILHQDGTRTPANITTSAVVQNVTGSVTFTYANGTATSTVTSSGLMSILYITCKFRFK